MSRSHLLALGLITALIIMLSSGCYGLPTMDTEARSTTGTVPIQAPI
ncbi:MAG: hypothetical protein ISS63_00835 [Desulfobacteraceae bacterium]|nr:hypothetical protein [Desulfobacteraceae bacterium]